MNATDAHHRITDGRFACTAPPAAPCRTYPTCDCEEWDLGYSPTHAENIRRQWEASNRWRREQGMSEHPDTTDADLEPHRAKAGQECWVKPWIDASDLGDTYADDAYCTADAWPDGAVETEWNGDCVTWVYADPNLAPTYSWGDE